MQKVISFLIIVVRAIYTALATREGRARLFLQAGIAVTFIGTILTCGSETARAMAVGFGIFGIGGLMILFITTRWDFDLDD